MRTNTDLIKKIEMLKEIKPRKEWVVLTKKDILGIESKLSFNWFLKPALAGAFTLCLLGGTFILTKSAMPGDYLYPLKKIAQKTIIYVASEKERPTMQLGFANEKLENLIKVAENNQSTKLAPIINEYKADISEATKSLTKTDKINVKEIVATAKKIEENKKALADLGINIGDEPNALAKVVELQIKDLEKSSLSEKQLETLGQVKKDYENGNYSQALENILLLSNLPEK